MADEGKPAVDNRLKEIRLLRGYTQPQLADIAGTSAQQISRLETGERKLTHGWMQKLAVPLGVSPAALIDNTADLPVQAKTDSDFDDEEAKRLIIELWNAMLPADKRRLLAAALESVRRRFTTSASL